MLDVKTIEYHPTMTTITSHYAVLEQSYYSSSAASRVIESQQKLISCQKYQRMLSAAESAIRSLSAESHPDCEAPTPNSIQLAVSVTQAHYRDTIKLGLPWAQPHVTLNESGAIVLEWVRNSKRLSFYVSELDEWYLRSWGPDTDCEMEDGSLTAWNRFQCWTWLMQ